jgi:hypothetical protein
MSKRKENKRAEQLESTMLALKNIGATKEQINELVLAAWDVFRSDGINHHTGFAEYDFM